MNGYEIFSIIIAVLMGIGLIYFAIQNFNSLNEQHK